MIRVCVCVAMKALMVMPALLLQKPSKSSKTKDHLNALHRRLKLWDDGKIAELIREGKTIQSQLKAKNHLKSIKNLTK